MEAPGNIKQTVDSLSRLLVLAEPNDPQAWARVYTHFEELGQWATTAQQGRMFSAIRATADLVEQIILEDVPNAEQAIETVVQMAMTLQAVIMGDLEETAAQYAILKETTAPIARSSSSAVEESATEPAVKTASDMERLIQAIVALEQNDNDAAAAQVCASLNALKDDLQQQKLAEAAQIVQETIEALAAPGRARFSNYLLYLHEWLLLVLSAPTGKNQPPEPVEHLRDLLATSKASGNGSGKIAGPTAQTPVEPAASKTETAPAPSEFPLEGDPSLLNDFILEAREHLEGADLNLLSLETDSRNDEAINALFRRFHTIKGVAGFIGLDEIRALAHESENMLDRARKGDIELAGAVIDAAFDSVDALKRLTANIQQMLATGQAQPPDPDVPALVERLRRLTRDGDTGTPAPEPEPKTRKEKIGDILVERGSITQEQVQSALSLQKLSEKEERIGEVLVKEGFASARDVAHALRSQDRAAMPPSSSTQLQEVVKVDAERLDQLIEMIGELVIAESMISQSGELRSNASAALLRYLSQLDKITRELQTMGTSLRMIPLRSTFQKMARLIRDLSKKSGKQVNFIMNGEDTELDKTVVDRIGDPLVHMIRNAVDHGLEGSPEERVAAGKPAAGRVELRAYHKGGNIYIEIEDDGRGLDRAAILAKGIERGLIREGETPSDREIYNMIFNPGFSTAKKITDVSGRGVGMDVVKKNIDALRGQIDIQTEVGRGTVFSIRLPLTLAIIDGMVIRVGAERYIIPTLSIIRSIRPNPDQLSSLLGQGEMMSVQNRLIPLFRLHRLFNLDQAQEDPTQAIIIIVEDDGRQIGLLTDELLGQQQIVIKPLGEMMKGQPGLSGGAIMSDGQVGLILDVAGLIRLAHEN